MRPTASSARDMLCVMANQLFSLQHRVGADLSRHPPPEYLHLDPRSGSQSDRQVAVSDVAPDGESVCAAADPADDRTIGVDRLSTVDGDVVLLADQQGAQTPLDPARLRDQKRLAPIEIALVEADAEPEPGLQGIVQEREVGTVIAVALLHPERVQRAVPTRPDANASSGGHQPVPHLHRHAGLGVELPSQLAHVGDALGEDFESLEPDGASLHEGEAFFRNVVIGDALQPLPRGWPPHPDDAQLLRRLAHVDGPILLTLLQPQPPEVAVHISGTGNQPEPMRAEPGDGDVPRHPSAAVEELGADDTADRPVDQVARHAFEQRERSRTVQLDLPERRHVDDPDAFAEGAMLLGLQLEPWRPGPAEAALVGTRSPPGPSRLEVLGSLPAVFCSEDRAEVLHPMVQGARPARPAPLVGVVRIAGG